jgi:alpha-beta hydrolase superfamily lysophospholipase
MGYVVALHGVQSHSGWYEYSSQRLCDAGFDVRFLDRRGSGLNPKDRGHADHPDRLINDVAQMLSQVCWERELAQANVPVILLGVSWGGKLAAVTAAGRPDLMDGLALLYPGLCARVRPRFYQRWLLTLATATGSARKTVRLPLDNPALFTGQSEWREFIFDDPLALHEATVSFLKSSVMLDQEIHVIPEKIRVPTLVMLAGRDEIIDNEATKAYLKKLRNARLELREYPEARHTLEFEPNRETIFSDLIDWLKGITAKSEFHKG